MLMLALATLFAAPAADPGTGTSAFDFQNGDRVAFIGGTLIEREQQYGSWELALTLRNKGKAVTFRNLGWSGDTPYCESRGSFDPASKGLERTIELMKELKPSVIVICYGHVEALEATPDAKRFQAGLARMIDAFAPTKARIILMTPTPFENVKPFTNAEAKNKNLQLIVDATKTVAQEKKLEFADLFTAIQSKAIKPAEGTTFTENGLHYDATGYRDTSAFFQKEALPLNSATEAIREKIVAKNELFFHRWRPQNQTYLFGFRKAEQGKNGKEIAEFDPLVEAKEKEIRELVGGK